MSIKLDIWGTEKELYVTNYVLKLLQKLQNGAFPEPKYSPNIRDYDNKIIWKMVYLYCFKLCPVI